MKKTIILTSIFVLLTIIFGGFLIPPIESQSAASFSNPEKTLEEKIEVKVAAPSVTPPVVTPKPVAPKPLRKKPVPPKSKPATPTPTPIAPPPSCSGSLNAEFLCLINNYRKSKGLNALTYDNALNLVAQSHSSWMNTNSTMSHIGENGSKFYERCAAANTKCDAENVARGYTTAQKLFDGWKNSPSHNANMLGNHTKIGLSLVGTYTTLLFR